MADLVGASGAQRRAAEVATPADGQVVTQPWRLSAGGLVDRASPLRFTFDGRPLIGLAGDTLASALLANGVKLVGRSFKYHRPRGILSAGSEEPNALVELRNGARREPNTKATTVELFDGLSALSQNRWPSLRFDVGAVNSLFSPLFVAGFYYKTFMWPGALWERLYEPAIRRAAGLGRASGLADPDAYEKAWAHCDVLVVGSGPAGLSAALAAGRAGARVILCEDDWRLGGRLLSDAAEIDGRSGLDWADAALAELAALDAVTIMPRTAVFGVYDGGTYGALQRVGDHLPVPAEHQPRQRLWRIVARRCVVAAGAIERPIVFAGNDRPGVMLASAVRTYIGRFAVLPARRTVVFTSNDDGWRTVEAIRGAGGEVAAVVDPRGRAPAGFEAATRGVPVIAGVVADVAGGRGGVRGVTVATADGAKQRIDAECLAVSGGFNPNIGLASGFRGRPQWRERHRRLRPRRRPARAAQRRRGQRHLRAGGRAARGPCGGCGGGGRMRRDRPSGRAGRGRRRDVCDRSAVARRRRRQGLRRLPARRHGLRHRARPPGRLRFGRASEALHDARHGDGPGPHLERQRAGDPRRRRAARRSPRRARRSTGRRRFRWRSAPLPGITGTSISTPPVCRRRTTGPLGAAPPSSTSGCGSARQWFPLPGETDWLQSATREVRAVRGGVGFCDVSTLGKIDVCGPDAGAFLDRVYINTFSSLPVGRARYGIMLREDGMVMDDGTTSRLAEDHYFVTTTTAKAGPVMQHLEFCRQVLWPELDVQLASATDQWAQVSIAGPRTRELLGRLADPGEDLSDEGFPFMGARAPCRLRGGLPARLFRISFSGELAFELAVPARFGEALRPQPDRSSAPDRRRPTAPRRSASCGSRRGMSRGPSSTARRRPATSASPR